MKRTIRYSRTENTAPDATTDLWTASLREGKKLLNVVEREYPTSWTADDVINDLSWLVVQNIGL